MHLGAPDKRLPCNRLGGVRLVSILNVLCNFTGVVMRVDVIQELNQQNGQSMPMRPAAARRVPHATMLHRPARGA